MWQLLKMNTDESTTKKRRLDSEVSLSSGITFLSNITQITEQSSDSDDNTSDSSSVVNPYDVLNHRYQSIASITSIQHIQINRAKLAKRQFARQRKVSWSLGDNETVGSDTRDNEDNPERQWIPVPYDNSINGSSNNRRRVRRVTESSLDTNVLSFNKPQHSVGCTFDQHNNFQQKLRSNITSNVHGGHEHDDSQVQLHYQVRGNYAQEYQSRRSQSVTSLGNDKLYNRFDSHFYQPLQQQNTANKRTPNIGQVDTTVSLTPNNSNYLQPITETKVQWTNFVKSESTSRFSRDESSAYADVMHGNEASTRRQGQQKCFDGCDNSFFRKSFYICLILNLALVLLNLFGLPYAYVAIRKVDIDTDGRVASVLQSEVCLDCDKLHEMVKKELSSEINTSGKKCCAKSAEQILQAFLKTVDGLARVPRTEKSTNVPVIQVKADSKNNYTLSNRDLSRASIVWKDPEINTLEARRNATTIMVSKTGYYYVYSRVHYKQHDDGGEELQKEFTFGHTIMKTEKNGKGDRLDRVVQRCSPSHTTGGIIHTNQFGSLYYLKQGDSLYVMLDHKQYFVYEDTLFGMFMVAT